MSTEDQNPQQSLHKQPKEKLIIYQAFPRILTNSNPECKPWGSLEQNGSGHLKDIDSTLIRSIKELGVNCIWLTGIIEHATKTSFEEYGIPADNPNVVKGVAGSAYAIKDYYDVAPAIASDVAGRMKEFTDTVKRIHDEEMKLLIDFVPNHTARVYHSDAAPEGVKDFGCDDDLTKFFDRDNNYYYIPNQQFVPDFPLDAEGDTPYVEFPSKVTGNDCFTAFCTRNDWYETVKLNYGHDYGDHSEHYEPVPDTWKKMLDILLFWASKGVDGFRCDMVFMVPLPFWHWVIPLVKKRYPDIIFIGEIYDVVQYRPFLDYGCFDYLYDKVNLYDTLVGIERHNFSAAQLTACWQTVDGIGSRMLNFLENHDEVRFASPEFAGNAAKGIPYLVTSAMLSTGPFMLYYGQELGEPGTDNEGFAGDNNRSTIFDYWSYDTLRRWIGNGSCTGEALNAHERWLRSAYARVLHLCNRLSAVREGKFFDLTYANLRNPRFNPHRHFAWLRYDDDQVILMLVNFSSEKSLVDVHIPKLAFEMAGIPETMLHVNDLLWNRPHYFELSPDAPAKLEIGGYDALLIRLR